MLKFRARKLSRCRLFPLGALTRGLAGEVLTEMAELTEAGCVGFSQADAALRDTLVLQRALQYAATFGYTRLAAPAGCLARQGRGRQRRAWRRGWACRACRWRPRRSRCTRSSSWCAPPARACTCAACSSAAGVALLRAAKAEGLPVTADVSINSLHLSDVDIGYFNAAMRLTPPLRQGATATRCAPRWPTARSTRWCPTTTRWTTTPRRCPSARPSPAPPGWNCCSAWR